MNLELEPKIQEYIKTLKQEQIEHKRAIEQIEIKINGLNDFLKYQENLHSVAITVRKEEHNQVSGKFMDEKDIKKINLFYEFLDKCAEDNMSIVAVKKKMPKLEYYCYNKKARFWSSFGDFKEDFGNWVNRVGYWTNAYPLEEGKVINPEFPIMQKSD